MASTLAVQAPGASPGGWIKQMLMWYVTTLDGMLILAAIVVLFVVGMIVANSLDASSSHE